ncbi:MAG: glycosyltransferase family 2 protein [Anaerolineales bacterium]|nr:glycosyltransferase family 2 protein [Anaerolineales bacterium]
MARFSLIVPTLGRVSELDRLLDSISHQTYRDFQVIVIDQNLDDRLLPLIGRYLHVYPIKHQRVQFHGAAKARNAGLELAESDFVLWPDDDSWLPHNLLENASALFDQQPELGGFIGVLIDGLGVKHNRWAPSSPRQASLMDAFTLAAEPVLFFRREVVRQLSGFDPAIGTGAETPWAAGEGTDLCVRALCERHALRIEPSLTVFHAQVDIQLNDERQQAKARSYARGMGRVLKKNRLPWWFVVAYLFTYLRALMWNILRGKWANVRYHWERLVGVMEGIV